MNKKFKYGDSYAHLLTKLSRIMRLLILMLILGINSLLAASSYSQSTKLTLKMSDTRIEDVLNRIESKSEFFFLFDQKQIDVNRKVSVDAKEETITEILDELFSGTGVRHQVIDRQIVLTTFPTTENQVKLHEGRVAGKVTDTSGTPIPGASVVIKGTTTGVTTDNNGKFSIELPANAKVIVFSFVGMKSQEIAIGITTVFDIVLAEETIGIDEVVAIGYGTLKKS